MNRNTAFVEGEIYHVYSRGVEKRTIFCSTNDYERFTLLLLLANSGEKIQLRNIQRKYQGEPLVKIFEELKTDHAHTDVLSYALMPNHFHLILREKKEQGISTYMHRLMTAYSMYFNIKYERSGPLFTRPFRSRHVDTDAYFRWLFAYIHLNPLELSQPEWKVGKLEKQSAAAFISSYSFSSFHDFFLGERMQSSILNKTALPISIDDLRTTDNLIEEFSSGFDQGESLVNWG